MTWKDLPGWVQLTSLEGLSDPKRRYRAWGISSAGDTYFALPRERCSYGSDRTLPHDYLHGFTRTCLLQLRDEVAASTLNVLHAPYLRCRWSAIAGTEVYLQPPDDNLLPSRLAPWGQRRGTFSQKCSRTVIAPSMVDGDRPLTS